MLIELKCNYCEAKFKSNITHICKYNSLPLLAKKVIELQNEIIELKRCMNMTTETK